MTRTAVPGGRSGGEVERRRVGTKLGMRQGKDTARRLPPGCSKGSEPIIANRCGCNRSERSLARNRFPFGRDSVPCPSVIAHPFPRGMDIAFVCFTLPNRNVRPETYPSMDCPLPRCRPRRSNDHERNGPRRSVSSEPLAVAAIAGTGSALIAGQPTPAVRAGRHPTGRGSRTAGAAHSRQGYHRRRGALEPVPTPVRRWHALYR